VSSQPVAATRSLITELIAHDWGPPSSGTGAVDTQIARLAVLRGPSAVFRGGLRP